MYMCVHAKNLNMYISMCIYLSISTVLCVCVCRLKGTVPVFKLAFTNAWGDSKRGSRAGDGGEEIRDCSRKNCRRTSWSMQMQESVVLSTTSKTQTEMNKKLVSIVKGPENIFFFFRVVFWCITGISKNMWDLFKLCRKPCVTWSQQNLPWKRK